MQAMMPALGILWLVAGASAADIEELGPEIVNDAPIVPLVRVVATPQLFHEKAIEVRGFVRLSRAEFAVYLSKEAAEHGIHEHAIWIDFTAEYARTHAAEHRKLDGTFACVVGFFDATKHGPVGGYSGSFDGATVRPIAPPKASGSDPTSIK